MQRQHWEVLDYQLRFCDLFSLSSISMLSNGHVIIKLIQNFHLSGPYDLWLHKYSRSGVG